MHRQVGLLVAGQAEQPDLDPAVDRALADRAADPARADGHLARSSDIDTRDFHHKIVIAGLLRVA
jgi:hypothetical protein